MNASRILFALKALILAVPFVLARDLIRDLGRDLARFRSLSRDVSLARKFTRELNDIYGLAYTLDPENDHSESD